MLWGGLRPIPYHVVWDAFTILAWIVASGLILAPFLKNSESRRSRSYHGLLLMLLSCGGTYIRLGGHVTNRWTITLPMVPLLIIHAFSFFIVYIYLDPRHLDESSTQPSSEAATKNNSHFFSAHFKRKYLWNRAFPFIVAVLSVLCILSSILLSILFPAVELPRISNGKYDIGVIDFYIPLARSLQDESCSLSSNESEVLNDFNSTCRLRAPFFSNTPEWMPKRNTTQLYLPVRLLYPTHPLRSSGGSLVKWCTSWTRRFLSFHTFRIPYLRPETAIGFCQHSMRFGAPEPIKSFDWMLHTWRLTSLPLRRNAPLFASNEKDQKDAIPLVVFSHGLGGDMDIYSFQVMSLAARGYLVLTMTHTDGTAPYAPQPTSSSSVPLPHNDNILTLYVDGKVDEYERARRNQNEIRVHEYLTAVDYIRDIISGSSNEPDKLLEDKQHVRKYLQNDNLVVNATYFMGHSFGAATALTAAYRRPDIVDAVIAHEPAFSWASTDFCHSMFSSDKLDGINLEDHEIFSPICSQQSQASEDQTLKDGSPKSIHDLDILILNSNEWMNKNWGKARLLREMHRLGRIGKNRAVSYHGIVNLSHHNEFSDTCMLTPLWLARAVGLTGVRNPIDTAREIATITLDFLEKSRLHLLSTKLDKD